MTIVTWRSGPMTPVQQAATKLRKADEKARVSRLQLILEVLRADDGETPIAEIAEQAGVARKTVYEWVQKWTIQSVENALAPTPRSAP